MHLEKPFSFFFRFLLFSSFSPPSFVLLQTAQALRVAASIAVGPQNSTATLRSPCALAVATIRIRIASKSGRPNLNLFHCFT